MVLHEAADQSVSHLVISDQTLAASVGQRVTFQSRDDAVNGIINFSKADGFLAATSRKDRRFVQEVGQVCTRETRSPAGNAFKR